MFLEPDEFAAFLAALPERWRLLVEFLLASAARWGEVTALRVRDINRTKLTARIHKGWKYTSNKPVRIHDLRHSCAAWMLTARVPIHVVQARLGHESVKTTVDVYGHLDRHAAAEAAGPHVARCATTPGRCL